MARRPKGSPPSYCLHKQSGQACINWPLGGGKYKAILLGKHGSPESHKEYERILTEWRASQGMLSLELNNGQPAILTVAEMLLRFWQYAEARYRLVDGSPSRELEHYRYSLKPVLNLYGDTLAREFGPLALKAIRQHLIDAKEYQVQPVDQQGATVRWLGEDKVKPGEGLAVLKGKAWVKVAVLGSRQALSRKVINQRIDHVRRVWKWAASEELVPQAVYQTLTTVPGLRRGQQGTRDRARVKPVADEVVEATLPFLLPPVRALVQLQRLMGARPTEVCLMRGRNIDRSGRVWWYRIDPNEIAREDGEDVPRLANLHKTAHQEDASGHAAVKLLPIGPRAQKILQPHLEGRDPDAFLFNPAAALQQLKAEKRAQRQTPLWASHVQAQARKKKSNPQRAPRDHYDRRSYAQAVKRAAKRAGVPHWHPHQLKHAIATQVRRLHGAEAAQVYVGHTKLSTTEIYAEKDLQRVEQIALEIG